MARFQARQERPKDRRPLAAPDPLGPGRYKFSRAMALFVPGEAVVCPYQHELSAATVLLPAGLRQCRFRDHVGGHLRGAAYCPVWMWIWAHQDGSHTVAWIEESERSAIADMRMTTVQVRDYLGLHWPTRDAA